MLRDDIRKKTGKDLPISGGYGTSTEDAIVIHHRECDNMYGIEAAVLDFLLNRYCSAWARERQVLLSRGEEVYDRFDFVCEYHPGKPEGIDLSRVHFNITECWK